MPHECPGCGKPEIPTNRLSCPRCWYRLPESLRTSIWRAYRSPGPGSALHRELIAEALDWYAAN